MTPGRAKVAPLPNALAALTIAGSSTPPTNPTVPVVEVAADTAPDRNSASACCGS